MTRPLISPRPVVMRRFDSHDLRPCLGESQTDSVLKEEEEDGPPEEAPGEVQCASHPTIMRSSMIASV